MRILLDTNIFIPLEDSSIELTGKLAELNRLASGAHPLIIHPSSYQDIRRDKDADRRSSMLLRLKKYQQLESPPLLSREVEEKLFGFPKKDNDRVDNRILYALYRNCVHWLITEDKGIHDKARILGERERVLTVNEAIEVLSGLVEADTSWSHPHIEQLPCHDLDIRHPFFDSLREGYGALTFNEWFVEKCCKAGRKAWVCKEGNKIHAICIYKTEENEVVTKNFKILSGKVLKLCTFKVATNGCKLGELMLKQAFHYAVNNGVEHVYATIEPNAHRFLEDLLTDFGFMPYGVDVQGRDEVYVKSFPVELPVTTDTNLEYAIKYYPAFRLQSNKAYLIPIQPRYHQILFPELRRQQDIFSSISNSAGNSIKQAYLSRCTCKSIMPGDVIFFYMSEDEMAVTSYGIVDDFVIERDPEVICQLVSKRTVYSYGEIVEMASGDRDVKVILFRFINHLKKKLTFDQLKNLGVAKGYIQSVTTLSKENAVKIIRESEIDDCLISD